MSLEIRHLTPDDASLLQRFLLRRDDEEGIPTDDEERQKHTDITWCHRALLRRHMMGAIRTQLLATLTHEVLEMEKGPPWIVDIANVYVLKHVRHKKVGTALMGSTLAALERTPYYGGARLDVDVTNAPAIALYEKFGFRKRAQNLLTIRGIDTLCYEMQRMFKQNDTNN